MASSPKATETAGQTPEFARPPGMTRYRYVILAFLFAATFINYLDRATLSVVKGDVQKEIGATETQMGFILSAFAWSITLVILVFGVLMQRFGARAIGTVSIGGFSVMTLLTATATSFPMLSLFRLGLGVFEAPTFPLNSHLARSWFPRSDRAKAVSIYMTGSFFGLAFAVPLLGWILGIFNSWHSVFVFAGLLGLVITILWWIFVRSAPSLSPRVSQAEIDYINGEPEAPVVIDPPKPNGRDWLSVFFERRLIGIYLGAFGTSTVVFFFITWFPDFLATQLGVNFKTGGAFFAALPFISGMIGMLTSGWLSDHLVKTGKRPGEARRITVTIGLSGVVLIALVPFLGRNNVPAVMALLCVSFFFAGMANTAWLLAAEIAKPRLLGLTTGVYGFWVNLFGALTPIIVGVLLDATQKNYGVVFGYVSAAALVGALAYIFIVDKVEPAADRRFPEGTFDAPRG